MLKWLAMKKKKLSMLQLEEEEGSTEKRELKKGVNLRVERGVESGPERGVKSALERGVNYKRPPAPAKPSTEPSLISGSSPPIE